jgi:hypothetical protein
MAGVVVVKPRRDRPVRRLRQRRGLARLHQVPMHPPAASQQGEVMGEPACGQRELVGLAGLVTGVRVV